MREKAVSLLERIREVAPRLSPKQRILARYIADNYKDNVFVSSINLALNAGVSEATVTRLAYSLGYPGYSELQSAIQQLFYQEIHSLEKYPIENSHSVFGKVISLEKGIMEEMLEGITQDNFDQAVDLIFNAADVVIVGTQFSRVVAEYASIYLNVFKERVHKVLSLDPDTFNSLQALSPNSVALIFSFPRYPKQTQEVIKYLKEKNIKIIGITDSVLSPIASFSSILFCVPQKFISFVDPYGAVMALVHSLLIGVFLKDKDKSREMVKKYDRFLEDHDSYVLGEVEIVDLL